MKHLFLFYFLLMSIGHLEAQIANPRNMPEIPLNFEECKAKNYRFKAQNIFFNDKDKIRFCPNNLPDTIDVVDMSGNPITFTTMWKGAKPNPTNTYSAIIDMSNYSSGADITVEFTDASGMIQSMKLKTKGNADVSLKNDGSSNYAFDDNMKMGYPSYNTTPVNGIPWKFLESSKMESMEAKAGRSYPPVFFQTSKTTLSINPTNMSGKTQIIQLNHPATLSGNIDTIDVNGCSTNPELKVLVGDAIHKTVNFVYVCDSMVGCPPNVNIPQLVTEANNVLNKAGLYISVKDTLRDTLTTFSVFLSDHIINQSEQENLHRKKYLGSSFFSSDYLVMIVPDLGGSTLGRATLSNPIAPPPNSLALNAGGISHGSTLAHEIGHAAFKLAHPDDPLNLHHKTPICDLENFMFFTALNPPSSSISCKGTRINNIRAFQFNIIHQIR